MKTGLVRHFTGAKYCVQAHLAVIRLLLECCGACFNTSVTCSNPETLPHFASFACTGQGSTNNSLIVQKCQTLYPSDVLVSVFNHDNLQKRAHVSRGACGLLQIPLYVEPGVLWNSKVLYLDLLSYLYIDTAAPTKGSVTNLHLL